MILIKHRVYDVKIAPQAKHQLTIFIKIAKGLKLYRRYTGKVHVPLQRRNVDTCEFDVQGDGLEDEFDESAFDQVGNFDGPILSLVASQCRDNNAERKCEISSRSESFRSSTTSSSSSDVMRTTISSDSNRSPAASSKKPSTPKYKLGIPIDSSPAGGFNVVNQLCNRFKVIIFHLFQCRCIRKPIKVRFTKLLLFPCLRSYYCSLAWWVFTDQALQILIARDLSVDGVTSVTTRGYLKREMDSQTIKDEHTSDENSIANSQSKQPRMSYA